MQTLINLIGEQPIPNLLPVLYLKPRKTIILFTPKTENVAKRLCKLVKNCNRIKVEPYEINSIFERLENELNDYDDLIFNITGGTKLMSIGLFQYAIMKNAEIVYLQSEKNKSILHKLKLGEQEMLETETEVLPELINVKQYLKAHLPGFEINKKHNKNDYGIRFENAVVNLLKENNFEVLQGVIPTGEAEQVEIDAVFRLKGTNNVAIAEIKVGDPKMERPKKGLDQLSTAGSREYLGIYTKKFLITARRLNRAIKIAAERHNTIVIDGVRFNHKKNKIDFYFEKKLIEKLKQSMS